MKKHLARLGPKLPRYYAQIMSVILLVLILAVPAMATDSTTGTSGNTQGTTTSQGTSHAGENMWDAADRIIRDVYTQIAGISTVLAGLMSAVAVVGRRFPTINIRRIKPGIGSRGFGLHGRSSTGWGLSWHTSVPCLMALPRWADTCTGR